MESETQQGRATEIQNFKIRARKLVDDIQEMQRKLVAGSLSDRVLDGACDSIERAILQLDQVKMHDL